MDILYPYYEIPDPKCSVNIFSKISCHLKQNSQGQHKQNSAIILKGCFISLPLKMLCHFLYSLLILPVILYSTYFSKPLFSILKWFELFFSILYFLAFYFAQSAIYSLFCETHPHPRACCFK